MEKRRLYVRGACTVPCHHKQRSNSHRPLATPATRSVVYGCQDHRLSGHYLLWPSATSCASRCGAYRTSIYTSMTTLSIRATHLEMHSSPHCGCLRRSCVDLQLVAPTFCYYRPLEIRGFLGARLTCQVAASKGQRSPHQYFAPSALCSLISSQMHNLSKS